MLASVWLLSFIKDFVIIPFELAISCPWRKRKLLLNRESTEAAAPENEMILFEHHKVPVQALWLCLRKNHNYHKHSQFHTY